jgi:hypothetical protein
MIRKAEFTLITDPDKIQGVLKYRSNVKAVCLFNDIFTAFTVIEQDPLWPWGKKTYMLSVKLHNVFSGHIFGNKEFDTLEEAVGTGALFIKNRFDVVTEEMLKEQE